MATVGRITGLGVDEEYRQIGPAMLGAGSDAQHNMEICISLSVDSPPMKKHPEAYELLATLAMLPIGTTYDALAKRWARGIPNLTRTLQILSETSLVERRKNNFFVLPVIRSYILDHSRFPAQVRSMMVEAACNFLAQHKSSPGDASFKDHATALSAEEDNLQAILLDMTFPEPSLIEALLVLAKHQMSMRPRLEVIEHTRRPLVLACQMKDNEMLLGDTLECYGWILRYLARHDDALQQLCLARQTFLSIPDRKRAAQCSLRLVEVYCFTDPVFERNSKMAAEAGSDFEMLEDTHGVALSLYYSGIVYGQDGRNARGIGFLRHAKEMFRNLGDPLHHAHCSFHLSTCYYWEGKYEDALTSGASAVQEYEQLGQYTGDATRHLGRVLFTKGDYTAALTTLVRSLETDKSYGLPLAIAQSLEYIGRTWEKMGRKTDAKRAYEEAMRYYVTMETSMGELGMICCQFLTRAAEDPLLVPNDDEKLALAGFYQDFRDHSS